MDVCSAANATSACERDELDTERGYVGIQAENKAFDFHNLRIRELGQEEKPSRQ